MAFDSELDDQRLLSALRRGDEEAFLSLVDRYQISMLHICQVFVPDAQIAEEVVQDTWIDMLQGLNRFEGRSSFKTWLFTILLNNARTRGKRERRLIPWGDPEDPATGMDEPGVTPPRFTHSNFTGVSHWGPAPWSWGRSAEDEALSKELFSLIQSAIRRLPQIQQVVFSLRDIQGWSSGEVCNILALSQSNHRVILHRARSKIRRELESYF